MLLEHIRNGVIDFDAHLHATHAALVFGVLVALLNNFRSVRVVVDFATALLDERVRDAAAEGGED